MLSNCLISPVKILQIKNICHFITALFGVEEAFDYHNSVMNITYSDN